MKRWYAVTRRYRVEDVAYVEAVNAKQAETKVKRGEYVGVTGAKPVGSGQVNVKGERREGVPHWLWERMGSPEDVPVQGGSSDDQLAWRRATGKP